jgi:hypothetical protein
VSVTAEAIGVVSHPKDVKHTVAGRGTRAGVGDVHHEWTEFPEPNTKFEKFAVAAAVAPDEPTGTLQVIVKSDEVVMATAWAWVAPSKLAKTASAAVFLSLMVRLLIHG